VPGLAGLLLEFAALVLVGDLWRHVVQDAVADCS
jgi:hypothetical protein